MSHHGGPTHKIFTIPRESNFQAFQSNLEFESKNFVTRRSNNDLVKNVDASPAKHMPPTTWSHVSFVGAYTKSLRL